MFARSHNDQANACVKEMPADLVARRLQIIFSLMDSTRRCFKTRSHRLSSSLGNQSQQPRQPPTTRPSDVLRVVPRQPVVMMKELAIQSLHRTSRLMTAMVGSRPDRDLDATSQMFIRLDCPQDAAHRIGKVPVQQILKLSVPQDRKQFRDKFQLGGPRLPSNGRRLTWNWRFRINIRDRTVRIVRDDRPGDNFLHAPQRLHKQRHATFVQPVLQRHRQSKRIRLMNRRQCLLHIPRPAFIRRRCGDEFQHPASVSRTGHSIPRAD